MLMLTDMLNQRGNNHLLYVLPVFFPTLKQQHVPKSPNKLHIFSLSSFFCFPGFPGPWGAFYRHLCFERAALGDPSEEVEALGEEEL